VYQYNFEALFDQDVLFPVGEELAELLELELFEEETSAVRIE
jgi:hypothetical protein